MSEFYDDSDDCVEGQAEMHTEDVDEENFYGTKDNENRIMDKYRLDEVNEEEYPLRAYYMLGENRRYCGFRTLDEFIKTMRESGDGQWHEIIRNKDDGWQKFFIDIDCKTEELTKVFPLANIPQAAFERYVEEVVDDIKSLFACENLHVGVEIRKKIDVRKEADIMNLTSSREAKFSRHLICRNIVIKGIHAKCFGVAIRDSIQKTMQYLFGLDAKSAEIASNWIDLSVYDKHHSLRTHLSTKKDAPAFSIIGGNNDVFNTGTLISIREPGSIEIDCCDDICVRKRGIGKSGMYLSGNMAALDGIDKILDGISAGRFNDYKSWCQIGMALYNTSGGHEEGLNLWKKYSAKRNPAKYKENGCESHYLSFKLSNNGVTIGTILAWAKNDCITTFIEYKRLRMHPVAKEKKSKFDNYSSQVKNASYIKNLVLDKPKADIETHDKYLRLDLTLHDRWAIKSSMNTGKSTLILAYIRSQIALNPDFTCVMVQFRTSLSDDVIKNTREMGFTDYRDYGGELDLDLCNRLIIQVESLHRLVYDHIDLLIIDEVESVDVQLFAGLNASHNDSIQSMFKNILLDSKQIIIMDGLLRGKTISAYESFISKKFYVHVNTPPVEKKKLQIMVNECQWKNAIVDDLCVGRKIYVVSSKGKNYIEKLSNYINAECKRRYANITTLTIYGEKDNSAVTKNFSGELVKYDLVIASPTVSAGVDFNVEGYFYKVYSYVSSRKVGADSQLQSLKRVRKPICKDITMVVQNCSREALPLTPEDIIETAESKIWRNTLSGIKWPVHTQFTHDKRGNITIQNKEDNWFKFFLEVQSTINKQKFDVLGNMIVQLTEEGYEAELIGEVTNASSVKLSRVINKIVVAKSNKDVADAKEISSVTAYKYSNSKNLTPTELAELSKYNLRDYYGWNGPITEAFVKKYKVSGVSHMFIMMKNKNTPLEKLAANSELRMIGLTDIDKTKIEEYVDRHHAIRELLTHIKSLENDKGELIHNSKTGGVLDKLCEYVNTAIKNKHSAYKGKNIQTSDKIARVINGYIEDYGLSINLDGKRGDCGTFRIYKLKDISKEYFTFDQNDKTLPYIEFQ